MAKRKPREVVADIVPEPVVDVDVEAVDEGSLFDDAPPVEALARPDDGIPPLDTDLTIEEKAKFTELLNKALPLEVRAQQLAKLAMFTDQKRAAVGLRAIQEINALTGVAKELPVEAAPMFQLPKGTTVSVSIKKVDK